MPEELKNKNIFAFEITTTNSCNFKCSYCYERGYKIEENILITPKIIKEVIDDLFKNKWFTDKYDELRLVLWGGEPLLNTGLCNELLETFKDDERVSFYIYTNGSFIHRYIPIFMDFKDRLEVQVSYDGTPIHDANRVDRSGIGTSIITKDAIRLLSKNNIKFGLKSTIAWKDFDFVPSAWVDFKHMHDNLNTNIRYSITVDYHNVDFYRHKRIVEEALIQIAKMELHFFEENEYFLSSFFRNDKAICGTRKNMLAINTNGDTYYCHGAIYSNCSKDLKYSNIFSEKFINNIRDVIEDKNFDHTFEPIECKNCISNSCLRCNVKKYEESNKEGFKEKWFDYTSQKELCDYYVMVEKIGQGLKEVLKERKNGVSK